MHAVRVLCALAGVAVIVGTSLSVLKFLVVPGGRVGALGKAADRVTDKVFVAMTRPVANHEVRHRIRSIEPPVILIVMLAMWLALFVSGFAFLLWPTTANLGRAFRESGSSLFTLGFASTHGARPSGLDFLAAATGLVVVALQIAYLPTLYSAFNRREVVVTLLGGWAGQPPWGPELLARSRFIASEGELPRFFRTWERWAADVAESHSSYPLLLRCRSPNPATSWLVALLAVMDSASLYSAVAPSEVPLEARLFLSMGFRCLRQLASTIGLPYEEDPRPDAGIELSREEFDRGLARLEGVGFPMERTPDEAWRHFQGWRVNYESIAYRIAWAVDAVPAAWSGPRRGGGDVVTPRQVVNRTPDDPEGRTTRPQWRR